VNPACQIVWQQRRCKWLYDADRLSNGNTLITLHKIKGRMCSRIIEVDPDHHEVWSVVTRSVACDADRLPDGTTVVAEGDGVRIYSSDGAVTSFFEVDWACEVNRY